MKDDELIFRARNGNIQAFAELIDLHAQAVRRFAFQCGKKKTDLDDITQEVFINIYRQLDQFAQIEFGTGLYQVTLDVVRNFSEKKQSAIQNFLKNRAMEEKGSAHPFLLDEEDRSMHGWIQELDENERIPVILFYFHDKSLGEIASITQRPVDKVDMDLSSGEAKLNKHLVAYGKSLDARLHTVKRAYGELPDDENRSSIIAAIKHGGQNVKKHKWFSLPAAVSIIGAGIIVSALIMQNIGENASPAEKPASADPAVQKEIVTEDEIKFVFESIRVHLTEKQAETEKKLGWTESFDQGSAAYLLHDIRFEEEIALQERHRFSQKELQGLKTELLKRIDDSLTLPSELIPKLNEPRKAEHFPRELEMNLMGQLEYFYSAFIRSLVLYEWEIEKELEKADAAEVAKKLNEGNEIGSKALKSFAEGAVQNGYRFAVQDGRVMIFKDYLNVASRLHPGMNQAFIQYLELRSNQVYDQFGKVISYKTLGELLVKLEKAILTNEDYTIEEWMKNDVQSFYAEFVAGANPGELYDIDGSLKEEVKEAYRHVAENYANTDTGAAVKLVYEEHKKNGFKKPLYYAGHRIQMPKYLDIPSPMYNHDLIPQAILPLSGDLLASYNDFAAKKDDSILQRHGPFEIMQFYFQADQQKDYATKYALYSKLEVKVSEEQYVREQEATESGLERMLENYDHATFLYSFDKPGMIVGIQLHYSDREEAPIFRVVEENGVWKVGFLPFQ